MPLRAIIAAVSREGVIGLDNKIPWHYPADMKRFKRLTLGTTVLMGRHTFDSIGKPLPGRRNLVITSRDLPGVECFRSLTEALVATEGDAWFIGGARIFAEAMVFANLIDLTYVPDHITDPAAVRFPPIDETVWQAGPLLVHEDDPRLGRREFRRRSFAAVAS